MSLRNLLQRLDEWFYRHPLISALLTLLMAMALAVSALILLVRL